MVNVHSAMLPAETSWKPLRICVARFFRVFRGFSEVPRPRHHARGTMPEHHWAAGPGWCRLRLLAVGLAEIAEKGSGAQLLARFSRTDADAEYWSQGWAAYEVIVECAVVRLGPSCSQVSQASPQVKSAPASPQKSGQPWLRLQNQPRLRLKSQVSPGFASKISPGFTSKVRSARLHLKSSQPWLRLQNG